MGFCAGGASYLREGIADAGYLDLRFAGGQMAHVYLSWLSPVKLRRMTIVGEQGMILYDDTEPAEKVKVFRGGAEYPSVAELQHFSDPLFRLGDVDVPELSLEEPLRLQCLDFLQCIADGRTPVSNAAAGAQVVRLLESAHKSIARAGRQVDVTEKQEDD